MHIKIILFILFSILIANDFLCAEEEFLITNDSVGLIKLGDTLKEVIKKYKPFKDISIKPYKKIYKNNSTDEPNYYNIYKGDDNFIKFWLIKSCNDAKEKGVSKIETIGTLFHTQEGLRKGTTLAEVVRIYGTGEEFNLIGVGGGGATVMKFKGKYFNLRTGLEVEGKFRENFIEKWKEKHKKIENYQYFFYRDIHDAITRFDPEMLPFIYLEGLSVFYTPNESAWYEDYEPIKPEYRIVQCIPTITE